eukprot:703361-Pelagomonas_calceolata.AAC.3
MALGDWCEGLHRSHCLLRAALQKWWRASGLTILSSLERARKEKKSYVSRRLPWSEKRCINNLRLLRDQMGRPLKERETLSVSPSKDRIGLHSCTCLQGQLS